MRRVYWAIVVLALIAVAADVAINASRKTPETAVETLPDVPVRVAVLPLEDDSPDRSQAVFARGLTREIVHQIARLPVVVAVGRSSVFDMAEVGSPDLETARRLEADVLLSGDVKAVGTARRILVDLRSVPEGELLWSHSYLIEQDVPFVMPPDLARSVAEALDFNVNGGSVRLTTDNLAAFEAYVAAGETDNDDARQQFLERALQLDPRFAAAWNALAAGEVMRAWNGEVTIDDAWRRAKPYLDRAFAIDPDSPQALVTLGRFQRNRGETEAAIATFRRALAVDPGDEWASANLGLALRWTGRYEEALAIHAAAVTMDPLSPAAQARLGTSHWFMGDFDEAARHYQTAIDLNPYYEESYDSWSGMLAFGLGRFDEALTMMRRKMAIEAAPSVRTLTAAGSLSSMLGNDADAVAYWKRAEEINRDYVAIHSDRARHHLVRRESAAARRSALTALELSPVDADAQLVLAILDLESDDRQAFRDRIRATYPAYFDGVPDLPAAHLDIALLVAQAMGEAGMVEEKLNLLSAIQESIDTPRARQHLWMAAVHAMRDETDEAMRYLNSSPPGRVRAQAPLLMRDPRFASLRSKPEFQSLIAQHLAVLRAQASNAQHDSTSE
jgi:tetratricopeptide (TPR) repeat protein